MHESLMEFFDSRGLRLPVDRKVGVLRGVKLLGLESRNGHVYLPESLSGASHLYEGAKVNVNHPKGSPLGPRDYQDRIGVVRNIQVRESEGLFGDFFFNPEHALAGQLAWDAEHAPENVGFSHNVQARLGRRGQQVVVEAITRVQSVDLVADPATTRGLFESVDTDKTTWWESLSFAELNARRPDLVEVALKESTVEIDRLNSEIAELHAREAAREKQALCRRVLAEYKLCDTHNMVSNAAVSPAFMQSLLEAHDESHVRQLIAEHALLLEQAKQPANGARRKAMRPVSRDQGLVERFIASASDDADAFVRAIT